MELVELITDSQTSREMVSELSNFLQKSLGKTIVYCNDTPGFIANRIGCFLLELTVRKGIKENLNPAQIDYIFSKFLGFPSTGIFGLYDLIGHDVMNLISASLLESLPSSDKYHQACFPITFLEEMKTRNFLGRKSSSGFYRLIKNLEGKRAKQVINFDNLDYDPLPSIVEYKDIQEVLNCGDKYSKFVSDILADFFSYVISLIPTVTESKTDIDKAMKLGYSLKYGPFELLSKMPDKGERWLKLKELNQKIPDNIKNHSYGKEQQGYKIILNNDSARLELIDNHHVFVIKSKMNSLDSKVFNLMIEAIDYCENKNEALYIFPLGDNFSAGANLKYFKEAIEGKNFKLIEGLLQLGQKAMLRLKYSKIPVISCARGSALGGGILLHSNFVVAHQNLNSGLVELGVGLIPGWGGGLKKCSLEARAIKPNYWRT